MIFGPDVERCELCGQVIAPTWETDPVEVSALTAEVERLRAEVARLSLHGSIALTARHATDCDTE